MTRTAAQRIEASRTDTIRSAGSRNEPSRSDPKRKRSQSKGAAGISKRIEPNPHESIREAGSRKDLRPNDSTRVETTGSAGRSNRSDSKREEAIGFAVTDTKRGEVSRLETQGLVGQVTVRDGARLSQKDSEILLPILEDMASRTGEVTEEELVFRSKPKSSPTHHLFEWDDAKAGHQHRLHQARTYIGSFEITFEGAAGPVRAFPNVVIGGNKTYVPMARALSDVELRDRIVTDALSQLEGWTRRFEALRSTTTLKPVFRAVARAARKK